jgi:hypothetical protein
MQNYQRIKTCVQNSSIPTQDQKEITDFFAEVSDEFLAEIAELFEKKKDWVSIYNDNRKKKREAVRSGNQELLNQILEEEKKYINDLTYGLD